MQDQIELSELPRLLGWPSADCIGAARGLGFPAGLERVRSRAGTFHESHSWHYDLTRCREWADARDAVTREIAAWPAAFSAQAGGAIARSEVSRCLGWGAGEFEIASSRLNFPPSHLRRFIGEDGAERRLPFHWRHEVDRWLDAVRTVSPRR